MRFFGDHDSTLPLKIARMRFEYCRINLQANLQASVEPSPAMRLDEKAPEIVALFDEYGRDAVLVAVRHINEIIDALGEDLGIEDAPFEQRHDGLERES